MLSETRQVSTTHMQSGLMSHKDKMQQHNFWMQWLVAKKLVLGPPRRDGLQASGGAEGSDQVLSERTDL